MNLISSRAARSFAPAAIVLAFTGAPLVGCSSAAPDPTETTQSQPSAVDTSAVKKSPCPSSLPRAGSSCTQDDLLCSWGDDTRFGCRQEARCESGAWTNLTDACPKKEPSCPLKAPKVSGSTTPCPAADLGITCTYGDTAYTCAGCNGTLCYPEPVWLTSTLPAACPTRVPDFGQACSTPNTVCNYNICSGDYNDAWVFGASMKCESGFWTAYAHNICL